MILKQQTTLGFIWVSISFATIQLLNMLSSIVLAWLLTPADFGQFALITVIIFFIVPVSELGMNSAIIQTEQINQDVINTAFTIVLILSIVLIALTVILSPTIASFFDEHTISTPLRMMALVILLASLVAIPAGLLERDLEFKKRTITEILPLVGSIPASIILALLGYGVWSLVMGTLVFYLITTLLIWRITSFNPRLHFELAIAKQLLKFGLYIAFGVILLYITTNSDRLYIGYFADTTTLGYYGLGITIGNWIGNVVPLINRVLFPAMSRSQGDIQLRKKAYLKVIRLTSLILFPATLGIFLTAPRMVLEIYGEKWQPATIFIQILVFQGLLRSFNTLAAPVFTSVGKPHVTVQVVIIRLCLLFPLMFILGSYFNAVGIGWATIIALALTAIYSLVLTANELELSMWHIFSYIATPIAATFIMSVGVGFASLFLPMGMVSLVMLILLGICLYGLALFVLSPRQILSEVEEVRNILAYKPEPVNVQ
jgi:O-antigen/teichoic acid export membrane protein